MRYLRGLDSRYFHVAKLQQYTTFEDVCVFAHRIEQQINTRQKRKNHPNPFPEPNLSTRRALSWPLSQLETHLRLLPRPLLHKTNPPPSHNANRRWHKCHGLGHIASDCPNRRMITPTEYQDARRKRWRKHKFAYWKSKKERRWLLMRWGRDIGDQKSLQCLEKFHGWTKGAYFPHQMHHPRQSPFLDHGQCSNMASTILIEKLGLQASVHPHLYCIQWLNQGKSLQVNSRWLVAFCIGKSYFDEVWYDIIPMDVCHVLLGRPWLFARRVTHDGYLNTYLFTKDGKTITLSSLAPH